VTTIAPSLDEVLVKLVPKTKLSDDDVLDLKDAIADGDTQGVATLMRVYARQGIGPDTTGWQDFADDLALVADVAGKIAPVVSLIVSIAPLL
jgi:hypothetical protein